MNYNLFYGFRGNIMFPDQLSIYNINLKNNSESKNKVFRNFSGVCHLTFYIKCIKVLFLGLFLLHYIKFYFIIIVGR